MKKQTVTQGFTYWWERSPCSLGLLCLEPIKLKVMLLQGYMKITNLNFRDRTDRTGSFFIKLIFFKKIQIPRVMIVLRCSVWLVFITQVLLSYKQEYFLFI